MGNDAERYRRFLDGDDNGLIEIIDEYHEGMSLYLNSIVNNMSLTSNRSAATKRKATLISMVL